MDAVLADGIGRELADALGRLEEARITLASAREATRNARHVLRKRQAEEAETRSVFERADAMRREAAARKALTTAQRIAALLDAGEDEKGDLAYEADWYRRLLQEQEAATRVPLAVG